MANETKAVVEEVDVVEGAENTQYVPTETHALTPEEAARQLLEPPASAAPVEAPQPAPMSESFPPGVTSRTIEGGYITETVQQHGDSPVAANADEDYQARILDTSVDYTQTVKGTEEGEVVEK